MKTTEDLVNEYPPGEESELLPADIEVGNIEPAEGVTPVQVEEDGPE